MNRYEREIVERTIALIIVFLAIFLSTQVLPHRTVKGIKNYEPTQTNTEKPYFEFGY